MFSVSQRRVNTIAQKMQSGSGIVDNRGGDKRSSKNVDQFQNVKKFIASLKGHESHYGRAKSRRIYLSSEYNITILWKIYNEGAVENFKVNYKYLKRGKKLRTIQLPNVALQNPIKPKKLQSLRKLLVELSGANWVSDPELTWLQPIFSDYQDQNDVQNNQDNIEQDSDIEEGDMLCDCNNDEDEFHDM